MDRLCIPLIFYSPTLPVPRGQYDTLASQIDIVPTALAMFEGEHHYSGIGRNLLDPSEVDTGIVGGTTDIGYFIKDNFVLEYRPKEKQMRLMDMQGMDITPMEAPDDHPAFKRLREEYFTSVEMAKRLSVDKRIFPLPSDMKPTWQ